MASSNLTTDGTAQPGDDLNDTMQKVGASDRKALGITLSTPILMMSTGVLGNLLALLILFTADKQVRRTSFFPLLMAMACSDLVGQAATGAIAVIVYANNLQWVGGRPVCIYHGFAMVFFAVVTPLLVCSMSVERMLALRFSYFYQRCFTHRIAKFIVFGSVTFTLFFCSWPLMGFGSYERQYPGSWCFLNYHRESLKDMVYALVFSILNIVIIAFIVLCNVTVVLTLLKMRRLRHQMHTAPSGGRELSEDGRTRSGLHLEMETQMVWFLLAITVVFSCLWLPINVHILINQITGKTNVKQDLITVRLASINQIIDPWMYVIFRKSTFFKCLRRIRRFVTRGKTACTSSMPSRSSHHHHHHHHQPTTVPRSRSCPPDACYSTRQLSLTDRVTDELLPRQASRRPLSASATDDMEISLNGPFIVTDDTDYSFVMSTNGSANPMGETEQDDESPQNKPSHSKSEPDSAVDTSLKLHPGVGEDTGCNEETLVVHDQNGTHKIPPEPFNHSCNNGSIRDLKPVTVNTESSLSHNAAVEERVKCETVPSDNENKNHILPNEIDVNECGSLVCNKNIYQNSTVDEGRNKCSRNDESVHETRLNCTGNIIIQA